MIDILSWSFAVVGALFVVIGALGILRLPNFEPRAHAASLVDVLGASLIIIAVVLQYGWSIVSLKLFLIILFLVTTSPVAIYALFNIYLSETTE